MSENIAWGKQGPAPCEMLEVAQTCLLLWQLYFTEIVRLPQR